MQPLAPNFLQAQLKVEEVSLSEGFEGPKIIIPKPIVPTSDQQNSKQPSTKSVQHDLYPTQSELQKKMTELLQNQSVLLPLLFPSTQLINVFFNSNPVSNTHAESLRVCLNPNFYPEKMNISFQNMKDQSNVKTSLADKGDQPVSGLCPSGLNIGQTKKMYLFQQFQYFYSEVDLKTSLL